MHVTWKRPDGHLNSSPSDYKVVELGEKYNFWLHKTETKWYPFRVSGGWQDELATKQLNMMVNLLDSPDEQFIDYVINTYHHSKAESIRIHIDQLHKWLTELAKNPKGDNWENEIITYTINLIETKIDELQEDIIQQADQIKAH